MVFQPGFILESSVKQLECLFLGPGQTSYVGIPKQDVV